MTISNLSAMRRSHVDRKMSALDPTIGAHGKAVGYARLAALASGLTLASSKATGAVQLSIAVPKQGGGIVLAIGTPGGKKSSSSSSSSAPTPAAAEKKEKPPKEKGASASATSSSAAAPAAAKKPSAAGIGVAAVPKDEPPKLDAAEIAACQVAQEVSTIQARLVKEAAASGLTSATFWRVRSDYYEQELAWRRDVLGASSVRQLCKSMIMENTKVSELSLEEATKAGRVKYVCVVLQYAGAKLQKEKLTDAVRRMEGSKAVGKKQYSLRMVSQEVSDSLSGYSHNAVTPLGMAQPVPVLLSDKIKTLPEGKLWLGGGEVDLKMSVDVAELALKFAPGGRPIEFADVVE